MNCDDMIKILEQEFPLSSASSWDNPGLQTGRREKEVNRVYIALDATDEVIEDAIKERADVLLTHHPMIFAPLKKVNTDDFIGKRAVRLIQNDISYYAMHTNYDVCRMAELSAEYLNLSECRVLQITQEENVESHNLENILHKLMEVHTYKEPAIDHMYELKKEGRQMGFGRIGKLPAEMSLKECCQYIKRQFSLSEVKVFGDLNKRVLTAAISPGSGKSMIKDALGLHADVLITGDIDHHDGIDAVDRGLAIVDAGHYGLEHIFIKDMENFLNTHLEEIHVVCAKIVHPFRIL